MGVVHRRKLIALRYEKKEGFLSFSQFNNMAVFHIFSIDHESNECPHFMPAFLTGCTGIHVQALEGIVKHHFKDMGMPADEQLRWVGSDFLFYAQVVLARVTANMRHKDFHLFACPAQLFREKAADFLAIDIAIHTFEGLKGFQLIDNRQCAKIAGMPDLITVFKMAEYGRVEVTMGIRDQSNACHNVQR